MNNYVFNVKTKATLKTFEQLLLQEELWFKVHGFEVQVLDLTEETAKWLYDKLNALQKETES